MTQKEIEDYLKDPENKKAVHANFVEQIDESVLQKFNITREALLNSIKTDFYFLPEAPALTTTSKLFPEPEVEKDRLHKQPRNYLKSTANLVGKATEETTLFSMPEAKTESGGNILREVISKNTAILGHHLLQLFQQNGKPELKIENLSPLAEMMGNSNYEIKIYLLYLGGYTYPIVDSNANGLSITTEQLFKITFNYSKEVANKYIGRNFTTIGTNLSTFIKDEPVESIIITPNERFIKALGGGGLGNVLVVNDKFVKLALSLTDIAYKIFTYSASNSPSQKIGEKNLVKHLGLEKQVKTQGRPRIRATIFKGLEELKEKGHIKSYSFDEPKDCLLYTSDAADE